MESSTSKIETIIKPVFNRAGIPLAITFSGFIVARIFYRKPFLLEGSSSSLESCLNDQVMEKDDPTDVEACSEEEILKLRSRITEVEERGRQLEKRFLNYQELKFLETGLKEIENRLILEVGKAEHLRRVNLLMNVERERFEIFVGEYSKVLRQLHLYMSENEHLRMKVKRLLRRNKGLVKVRRKQCLKIALKETEVSEHKKCIRLQEENTREMKLVIEQLYEKNHELLNNLRKAEESNASKGGAETENYKLLASDLERLQKNEAAKAEELIHLRWSNACLRHELMRKNQDQEQVDTDKNLAEIKRPESDNAQNTSVAKDHHARSKQRRLISKLKNWVEGTENNSSNCFRRRSGSNDGTQEMYLPARNSCSTV